MFGTRTWTHAGLIAALLLVGAAACSGGGGGDGGDGAGGADVLGRSKGAGDGDGAGAGGGGVADDPCSLLERSEIEQQFGAAGPVSEGEPLGAYCTWTVGSTGETSAPAGAVTLGLASAPAGESLEEFVTREPSSDFGIDIELNPTEVEMSGIAAGDALYDAGMGTLWVRSGDQIVFLSDVLGTDDPSTQDKLITLAQLAIDRL